MMESERSTAVGSVRAQRKRFALRFLAISVTLLVVYCFPYSEHGVSERWFNGFLSFYAQLAGALISVFDPGINVLGTEIQGRFAVRIVKSCDAMETKILFAAAVLAFPGDWWRRALTLVTGLAVLTTLNVLRISSIYFAGILMPSAVEVLHMDVWPLLMVAGATLLFLAATTFLSRTPAAERAAPAC